MFRSSVFKRIAAVRRAANAQTNKKPAHASASAGLVCGAAIDSGRHGAARRPSL
ncbi:hypothetical protein C7S16_6567 [Burkholderia thailandensis]|uniref:Uncharacterized protein n=1 Tax=Burkholderia thailandensis TaxID=57975 RepID=A0AAW9CLE1_BURTH|nr:hypothetical protein [Burkholderia thailandensis]MDW9251723.1 hypothetical protein [Burkholderia thailandensis]